MANRQIDPDGPYNHGYRDGELGLPLEGCPYLNNEQRREYVNGYTAAKLAERSPL
jgi:ribosome modulation factor